MSKEMLGISVQSVVSQIWRCAAPNAMCSSAVFVGERAVLVADSMLTPGLARQVKAAVRQLTDRPVRYLLNTHGDSDHVFGNQEFWPESVLLGHRSTRDRLRSQGEQELAAAKAKRPQLAADLEEVHIVAPELTFDETVEVDLADLRLECIYVGPAHTTGDVVVWAPDRRFLLAGDVVFNRIFPVMRNADVEGWLRALDRLEELQPEVVAPGHGEVGGRALIEEMRGLLIAVRDGVRSAVEQGLTLEQALETVRFPQYEGLPQAEARIPEAIRQLYAVGESGV